MFTDLPVQTTLEPLLWLLSVEAWLELKRVSGVGVATADPPSDCTSRGFLWGRNKGTPPISASLSAVGLRTHGRGERGPPPPGESGVVHGRLHLTFSEMESTFAQMKKKIYKNYGTDSALVRLA